MFPETGFASDSGKLREASQKQLCQRGDDAEFGDQESKDEGGTLPRQRFRRLLLFSGNDYLGLSSHPTIGKAASRAALTYGMDPRGSALICGYISYHGLLQSSLADLKKKEAKKRNNKW